MIECYLSKCPHHDSNDGHEGPFCSLPECLATKAQLEEYGKLRGAENKERLTRMSGLTFKDS